MKRQKSVLETPLTPFDVLPEHIVFIILDLLDENPADKKAFSLVCKSLYVIESRHKRILKPLRSEHLIKVLKRYPHVSNLDLSACSRVTDYSLCVIAASCKEMLKSINLSRTKFISDAGLSKLVMSCENLVEIDLSNAGELQDLGAAAIAKANNLERLWLTGCQSITDLGIGCIAVGCKKLKLLSLKWCLDIGDLGVGIIAVKCKDLRSLDLSFLSITNRCLPPIFELEHLEDLVLEGCFGLDDNALAEVKQCKSLEKLDVSYCLNVSSMGLFSLTSAAGSLRHLNLSYGFCVDSGLANSLHNFSALQTIKFDGCEITCSGLKSIGNCCASLRELSLSKCVGVTDEGLSSIITRNKDLRKLNITCCRKVTKVSLSSVLNSCTSLTSLKMESCISVQTDAFVSLGQQCPFLEELDLTDNEIDDEGLRSISRCCQLSILKLGICLNITDQGLIHIARYCTKIKELDLYRSAKITDIGILAVSCGCPNLEMINIAYGQFITESSLRYLSKCLRLHTLEVQGCTNITSQGLAAISQRCRQLTKLDIKKCRKIDDSGMISLAHFSHNLKEINLSYTCVTDVGLLSLSTIGCLQKITMLHLDSLTVSGIAAALLGCGVLSKVKLHTSLKSMLPQILFEHMEARGCIFYWKDKVLKTELDPAFWKQQSR